ncbi:MAG: response regulator transcription factor [Pleurocapsa sp. SU_196_0]|nr:response regulator transcription factor [Pleurocapsa sp. SU_196_0]
MRELLARVRALLRRSYGELSSSDGDLLFASDLRIDRLRAQVWRGEEALTLTPTEFKLLVYLVRNAGYALSREQIITEVWGDGERSRGRTHDQRPRSSFARKNRVEPQHTQADPHRARRGVSVQRLSRVITVS